MSDISILGGDTQATPMSTDPFSPDDADILPDRIADDPTLVDRDFRERVPAEDSLDPDELAATDADESKAEKDDADDIERSRQL